MENIRSQWVVTRKPHKCWGCAKEFEKGTIMRYNVSADSGDLNTSHWCKCCDAFASTMDRDDLIEGFDFGAFRGEPEYEKFFNAWTDAKTPQEPG